MNRDKLVIVGCLVTLIIVLSSLMMVVNAAAHHGARCHSKKCKVRVYTKHRKKVVNPYAGWLRRVRYCESGNHGLYRANTGNGFYGAYQFTLSSWRAVGGWGMPHHARPLEQDYRAVKLRWLQGTGAWPVCG